MQTKIKAVAAIIAVLGSGLALPGQGYIVPNGVTYSGPFLGLPGFGITVTYNPTDGYTTGFSLDPIGKTQPTVYTNTFEYHYILDVGVRAFLVSPNQAISQQAIQSGSYTELMSFTDYVFNDNSPFYVGLYTGNQNFYPPDGIYSDPLFGWARLVNNQGVIQLLDSALSYKAGGIYVGTQNLIPVPEPSGVALLFLSGSAWGIWRLRRRRP